MSGQVAPILRPPVGPNLDYEITRTGLTNEELARALNVPERQVRRWRNGETTPGWKFVVALARYFGRSPAWFYADHAEDAAC